MGQAQSGEPPAPPSHRELAKQLADKFARKCFTPLELYSFKDVFNSLADYDEHQVRYWKQDTIVRVFEIPGVLGVSAVLSQMISYIGAFPFLEDAPAVLGLEQMVVVFTILTERYRHVLATGAVDRRRLIFKSLAGYNRKLTEIHMGEATRAAEISGGEGAGQCGSAALPGTPKPRYLIDEPGGGDEDPSLDDDDSNDYLVNAALDSLGCVNPSKHVSPHATSCSMMPADNWRKLIMLLLLIAPLGAQESLSSCSSRVSGDELESLRATADCVLASFLDVERAPGIEFPRFDAVIPASMPFIFKGFSALFEHLLFSKNLDFHRHKDNQHRHASLPPEPTQPLLKDTASIMDLNILSQLSFFIPGSSLFGKLRLLFSGDEDGFSMGSFESKIFSWKAPTLLLVSGIRLPNYNVGHTNTSPASAFLAMLPPRPFPPGNRSENEGERLTFGAYLGQPWKHTHRGCFGAEDTLLFQLQPIHDVFHASTVDKDYASFTKPAASIPVAGISFGCPPPQPGRTYRHSNVVPLGPVSLFLESSFEFGCFTHNHTSQGGAFHTSVARKFDFQDRFEISSIEVWGCGGGEAAQHQTERWALEARETEARRRINLGAGDIEAGRALLEVAGLLGANRSGGGIG